ncbi:MAG: protein kinase [Candidatus Obscuribacterales bacterium]
MTETCPTCGKSRARAERDSCRCAVDTEEIAFDSDPPDGASVKTAPDEGSIADELEEDFPRERYRPLEIIGRGSSGRVVKCLDKVLSRVVAVKTLHVLEPGQLISFQDEAKATSRLDHPGIVNILDFGVTAGSAPYMVLEYVDGISLERYLEENGPLPWSRAVTIFAPIMEALDYAHDHGVFHRDLKPSNILLGADREDDVRIIDFGVARVKEETREPTIFQGRTVAGTPGYMSPDQVLGHEYRAPSEVYSLACVLFEALTGKPPFEAETALEILNQHASKSAPSLSECLDTGISSSRSADAFMARCLAKDPRERFATMEEMRSALLAVGDEPGETSMPGVRRQSKLRAAPLIVIITVFAGILAYFLLPGRVEEERASGPRQKAGPKHAADDTSADRTLGLLLTEPSAMFARLDRPRVVTYRSSAADDAALAFLKGSGVQDLGLNDCLIRGPGLVELRDEPLDRLSLRRNPIDDAGLDYLVSLSGLRALNLDYTAVTDAGLKKLTALSKLQSLGICGCRVSESSIPYLRSFEDLQILEAEDTPMVSEAGLKSLARLPRLAGLSLTRKYLKGDLKGLADFHLQGVSLKDGTVTARDVACLEGSGAYKFAFKEALLEDSALEALFDIKRITTLELHRCRFSAEKLAALEAGDGRNREHRIEVTVLPVAMDHP